jgi:hypothetical protein
MTLSDTDLRTLWQDRSAVVLSDRSACLTDSEWARLLSEAAAPAERVRAAGHIASCGECADEYRLLQPLQSWGADLDRVLSPPDTARADRWTGWRGWWSAPRMALAMAAAAVLLALQGVVLSQLLESRRQNAQLETQLAQNTGALSATRTSLTAAQEELRRDNATQAELQHRLAQLPTPLLGVAVVDLEPQDTGVTRGTSDPAIATVSANAPAVTLILNFSPLASRSTLEVEVAREGGPVGWVGRTQLDAGTSTLPLSLPRVSYPPGGYVIRLFDVTRDRRALASYPIVIQYAAGKGR